TLAHEARPFFGDPAAIVTETGAVAATSSRIDPDFGNVLEIVSDRRSAAHQLTTSARGAVGERLQLGLSYTLGHARDEGAGSFAGNPTSGNPNVTEWAASGNDRRHSIGVTAAFALTPEIELAALARVSSGSPFTPMVR